MTDPDPQTFLAQFERTFGGVTSHEPLDLAELADFAKYGPGGRDADARYGEVTTGRNNHRTRPRGYASWRPQRKSRELLDHVKDVLAEYDDFLPLTIRQIFYRLVGAHGYEKTEQAYERLCTLLVRARRARVIPFEVIRDDGVVTYSSRWHDGVEDFWDDAIGRAHRYRRDRQSGQSFYVELWCEAAGMAPQLARVANKFSVPVFSSGGFSSLTAIRLIADRAVSRNVPTVLLHVGDCDPSGESIFDAVSEDAAAFVTEDRVIQTQSIRPERVALTEGQVNEHELPTSPPKKSDSRSANWSGGTCQLEALPPDVLAEIVEDAVSMWFDDDKLEQQIAAEDKDRTELLRALPRGHDDDDEEDA